MIQHYVAEVREVHLFRMASISDAITVAVIICSANHGFDRQLIPVFIFKVLDRPN